MLKPIILGITGSFGAGKGEVVHHLTAHYGFAHYSVSGFIAEEARSRGLPINRDTFIEVANELRRTHGPSYIIDTLYERAKHSQSNVVIESLRAIAEVERIRAHGGVVIGVDADSKIRYARAFARGSEKDHVSYEYFLDQERREQNPNDPTKQNLAGALKLADTIIYNNGSKEELYAAVDECMDHLLR